MPTGAATRAARTRRTSVTRRRWELDGVVQWVVITVEVFRERIVQIHAVELEPRGGGGVSDEESDVVGAKPRSRQACCVDEMRALFDSRELDVRASTCRAEAEFANPRADIEHLRHILARE
jgi:hypothetical protein